MCRGLGGMVGYVCIVERRLVERVVLFYFRVVFLGFGFFLIRFVIYLYSVNLYYLCRRKEVKKYDS